MKLPKPMMIRSSTYGPYGISADVRDHFATETGTLCGLVYTGRSRLQRHTVQGEWSHNPCLKCLKKVGWKIEGVGFSRKIEAI